MTGRPHMAQISRRIVALAGLLILCLSTASPAAARADASPDGARAFVGSLAERAIAALVERDLSEAERTETFRALLVAHFDVATMGKWTLGRYWRSATEEQQEEYLALFEDMIVATYAHRFRDFTNERLVVDGIAQASEQTVVVTSRFVRDDGQRPARVDWRVAYGDNGGHKIVDVVIEGVSMVQTQRSEFSSVILRNGGQISSLIDLMRAKTRTARNEAAR